MNNNLRYNDIKRSTIKGCAEGYLGHKLSDSEFESMIDWWNSVKHAGAYFIPLGDFLRDFYLKERMN